MVTQIDRVPKSLWSSRRTSAMSNTRESVQKAEKKRRIPPREVVSHRKCRLGTQILKRHHVSTRAEHNSSSLSEAQARLSAPGPRCMMIAPKPLPLPLETLLQHPCQSPAGWLGTAHTQHLVPRVLALPVPEGHFLALPRWQLPDETGAFSRSRHQRCGSECYGVAVGRGQQLAAACVAH